jgi:glucose/arabinose dehydrogenase
MKRFNILILLITYCLCNNANAQNASIQLDSTFLETNVLIQDLLMPWDIAWGPDDQIWCTEQKNVLLRINPETKESNPVKIDTKSIPKDDDHYLGIQGLALHQDTMKNIIVYLTFLYKDSIEHENGYLRLTRFQYDSVKNELIAPHIIIDSIGTAKSYLPGGRMLIGTDQKLYLCTSDEHAIDSSSQKLNSLSGKILRFNLDGSIPSDNPNPTSPIYSSGYRNPQGIAQTKDGDIVTFCHGPSIDDELNLLKANTNYGWPLINGVCDTPEEKIFCEKQSYQAPIKAWTPTIAPGSMVYYNHPSIPEWENSLLLITLKEGDLRHLPIPDDIEKIGDIKEKIYLDQSFGRLRDICVAPNGNIYILTCNTIPSNHEFARPEMKEKLIYDAIIEIKKGNPLSAIKTSIDYNKYLVIAGISLLFIFLLYFIRVKKK